MLLFVMCRHHQRFYNLPLYCCSSIYVFCCTESTLLLSLVVHSIFQSLCFITKIRRKIRCYCYVILFLLMIYVKQFLFSNFIFQRKKQLLCQPFFYFFIFQHFGLWFIRWILIKFILIFICFG